MSPQESIAHYRIVSKIGQGGMGAVYRATDTKLQRDVAIKVLPEAFAQDADRMSRFTREAQVLASLNHPNIAAVYGIEEGALVMELVEGEDLAGPLPLDVALRYARQIAAGLEAAHEKGIIHRDLKPANIRITPGGDVKILDFGLAKATVSPSTSSNLSPTISPTLPMSMTQSGMILGTAAYMSPEQARGKPVDRRADIWAFGVVLYEMLTGKRLFEGETVSDTFANLFSQTINFDAVHAEVRPLLRRCLERDPKLRLRDIGEAPFLLEASAIPAAAPAVAAPKSRAHWWIAGGLALVAAVFAGLWWRGKNVPASLPHRYAVDAGGARISPDGRWLLSTTAENPPSLRVLANDAVEWRKLPGSEASSSFFWSPDSSAVGFVAAGRLRTVGVDGTGLRDLAPAPDVRGGAWNGGAGDGVILLSTEGRLRRYDLASRKLSDVAVPLPNEERAQFPVFLPEGDRFLFVRGTQRGMSGASTDTAIYVASLANPGSAQPLIPGARQPVFARHPRSGDWYLFYADGTAQLDGFSVYGGAVDPRTGQFRSTPVRILSSPAQSGLTGVLNYDVGGQGMVTWRKSNSSLPIWHLRWFDRNGNVLSTVGEPGMYQSIALSPDERQVAVHSGYPTAEIWIYNLLTGSGTRLSTESGSKSYPIWSPDGTFVYYSVQTDEGSRIVRRRVDGGGLEEVVQPPTRLVVRAITADNANLLMVGPPIGGGVYRLNLTAFPRTLETLIPGERVRTALSVILTPDEHWLLVETREGTLVYPYSHPEKDPVSTVNAPTRAFLSPDGKNLYGVSTPVGGRLLVFPLMPAAVGRGPLLGPVSQLFPITTNSRVSSTVAAVTRDGSRFLAISGDASEELKSQVLTDWTTLLTNPR